MVLDARELIRRFEPTKVVFTAEIPHPLPGGERLEDVRAEVERVVQKAWGAGARVEVRR